MAYEIDPLGARCRLRDKRVMRATWHQWANAKCAVPQTGMVGTDISDTNQSVQPRLKHRIAYPKGRSHITFWESRLQLLI